VAWFWTDDLARLLVDMGDEALSELVTRPTAIAADGPEEALVIARRLAGAEKVEAA
jgi:hypothetical protein